MNERTLEVQADATALAALALAGDNAAAAALLDEYDGENQTKRAGYLIHALVIGWLEAERAATVALNMSDETDVDAITINRLRAMAARLRNSEKTH